MAFYSSATSRKWPRSIYANSSPFASLAGRRSRMSNVEVRAVSEREQQAVIDVITLAFSTDPMARWAYPNPATYLAIMPETIKAFGGNGFAHGTVHLADEGAAAAMWLPPGVLPDSERLEALTGQHAPRERQAGRRAGGSAGGKISPSATLRG